MTVQTPEPQIEQPNVAAFSIIGALDELKKVMEQVATRMERPAPRIWRTPFTPTHEQVRVEWWVVTLNAAGTATLNIGTRAVYIVQAATADTFVIPLPLTITRGVDVTVAGANVADTILIGYTE